MIPVARALQRELRRLQQQVGDEAHAPSEAVLESLLRAG
jgi:hypothetical protein